ncbi:MAG: transposase [Pseudomonas sp.]|nr:transposase [Pseudomonas sp.]
MESERSHKRRRYSSELKAEILAECDAPGASVAKVAMSHGINANILHGWRKLARQGGAAVDVVQRDFVPVAIAPAPEAQVRDQHIEVELRRGALTMRVTWPMSAAADLAAWTRELLR